MTNQQAQKYLASMQNAAGQNYLSGAGLANATISTSDINPWGIYTIPSGGNHTITIPPPAVRLPPKFDQAATKAIYDVLHENGVLYAEELAKAITNEIVRVGFKEAFGLDAELAR
jgi:hypothetical protein